MKFPSLINKRRKRNMAAGILHQYANPSLISKERTAFEDALINRHSNPQGLNPPECRNTQ